MTLNNNIDKIDVCLTFDDINNVIFWKEHF